MNDCIGVDAHGDGHLQSPWEGTATGKRKGGIGRSFLAKSHQLPGSSFLEMLFWDIIHSWKRIFPLSSHFFVFSLVTNLILPPNKQMQSD